MDLDLSATLPRKRAQGAKPLDLGKVVALFEDEHTVDLVQRQVDVLLRVCRHNAHG